MMMSQQRENSFPEGLQRALRRTQDSVIAESGLSEEKIAGPQPFQKCQRERRSWGGLCFPGSQPWFKMLSSYHHTLSRPFSEPSPSSAIYVVVVVFLSYSSHWNFGRKGEESQDASNWLALAIGDSFDPVWSLGRQEETIRRPEASLSTSRWYKQFYNFSVLPFPGSFMPNGCMHIHTHVNTHM